MKAAPRVALVPPQDSRTLLPSPRVGRIGGSSRGAMMSPVGRICRAAVLAVFGVAASSGLVAQLAVDQVPPYRVIPIRERVEQEMESSRLQLGPFRITPVVSLDNAGYDSNVFHVANDQQKTGDWTATIGAGGRALLPMGSKFYLRLVAVPSYVWYNTLQDLNTWGGDFSAAFLALGNRVSFEADGAASKGSTILNSETQANVIETAKSASANFELDLTRALAFVVGGQFEQDRYAPGGVSSVIDVQKFDRTDGAVLAGLRLRLTPELTITGGAQGTRTEFVELSELRNNQTIAYLGGIRFDRPNFYINVAGGYRKAEAFQGSAFPDYATTVGSYFVSWYVAGPLEVQGYGHRRPVYSRFAVDQFYIETRNGGGIRAHVGPRFWLRGYALVGTNDYPFSVLNQVTGINKVEDALNYGGDLGVLLFGTTVLQAQVTQSVLTPRYGAGPERAVFRFTTGISFNGEWTK